jgi:hypothetical protein
MTIVLNGSTGITTPTYNGTNTAEYLVPVTQFKNRIINGAMTIDQRNAGASVTPAAGNYTLDRWNSSLTQSSKYTVQQNAGSVTPPTGFTNYLGVTSSSAYSVLTGDFFLINQWIEGFNTADLGWGTANAKTVTLSFWVRSSLTGTFGGSFTNSAQDRSYPFTYTINSANTWEQKTITVAGDTTGTWIGATNGKGMGVWFGLGAGSTFSGTAGAWAGAAYYSATGATSVVGTNGATFYITGVQLEVGSTATSFDYRPYGIELALCQRYFYLAGRGDGSGVQKQLCSGGFLSSVQPEGVLSFPVTMRTGPSLVITTVTNGYIAEFAPSLSVTFNAYAIFGTSAQSTLIYTTASGTAGYYARLAIVGSSTTTFVGFSAEL